MPASLRCAAYVYGTMIFLSLGWIKDAFSARPQESDSVVVKMTSEHTFMPAKLTIKAGQTVEWINDEAGGIHQVTDDPDAATDPSDVSIPEGAQPFDSHLIKSGKSFRQQFTVPGNYQYVCPPHEMSGMIGNLTVTK